MFPTRKKPFLLIIIISGHPKSSLSLSEWVSNYVITYLFQLCSPTVLNRLSSNFQNLFIIIHRYANLIKFSITTIELKFSIYILTIPRSTVLFLAMQSVGPFGPFYLYLPLNIPLSTYIVNMKDQSNSCTIFQLWAKFDIKNHFYWQR